jgi:hypothetical protein
MYPTEMDFVLVISLQDGVLSLLNDATPAALFESRLAFRVAALAGLVLPPASAHMPGSWGAGLPLHASQAQWDALLPSQAAPSESALGLSDSALSEYARGRLLACMLRLGLGSAGSGAHWLQMQLLDPQTLARHYLMRYTLDSGLWIINLTHHCLLLNMKSVFL